MKLAALAIIIHPLLILSFTALAVTLPAGQAGVTNPGLSRIEPDPYMNMPPLRRTTAPALKDWQIIPSSGT